MKSSSCHVEIQFANTDTETSNTKISQAQHSGAVSDHHSIHLVALPVVDHAGHLPSVVFTEIHSSGPTVEVGEVGTGPAHCGGVDDGSHLVEIIHQQPADIKYMLSGVTVSRYYSVTVTK